MPRVNATGYWDASDYGSTPLYTAALPGEKTVIAEEERRVLRELAARVARLAARPRQEEMRRLWLRHNRLEPTRPLIICDPENGWNEIIRAEDLVCSSRLARHWEMVLRKELFWGERMLDDRPIEAVFHLGYTATDSGYGVEEHYIQNTPGGSYSWVPVLKQCSDLDRLRFPRLQVDQDTTRRAAKLAREVFADFLSVRITGLWWWSLGLTYDLVLLRGMQQVMLDMFDSPSFVHELMTFLMEAAFSKLDFLEASGLLCLNNACYLPPGGFGHTEELPAQGFTGKVRTADMWGYAESQETVGISPEMFAGFIFPYQLRLLERFGLSSYGCCEPLERRWDTIRTIPRLRKVSVSAFADVERMAGQLGDRYCYCWKPHPADLAVPVLDQEAVRARLRRTFQLIRGCRVEVLMQDNHTIGGNPQNVVDWVRIAREEAERAAP
jgi:hypothetical protein